MTATLTAPDTTSVTTQAEQTEAFVGRLFEATLGTMDLLAIHLGSKLGYYRALAEAGPATPAELAARTHTAERYTREWLEQQAAAAILECDTGTSAERRYRLPLGHVEPLLDEESLSYLSPIARFVVATAKQIDLLENAYRTGRGVPYVAFGADAREAQAAFNRPAFSKLLGSEWLPALPEVHARLVAGGRVADIGCGGGWSSIAIARAYPNTRVTGFDADPESIVLARRHAAAAGLAERVTFELRDGVTLGTEDSAGTYDLVCAFEMVHDLAYPVDVLTAMRRLAGARGTVLVMDERVEEAFSAPANTVERFMYGASILFCLPTGIADGTPERPSAATGTVMRPDALRRYAAEAGFARVDVLPIEHDFFRFYRLVTA